MRFFITGVDGFIGSWLAETTLQKGLGEVFGLSRKVSGDFNGVRKLEGAIENREQILKIISEVKPDIVFHLASLNNVGDSFKDPTLTIQTNILGSLNLFDAVKEKTPYCRVISIGSSAEYGLTADRSPLLTEDMPLLPKSPYGLTKMAQGALCQIYFHAHSLQILHARPFAIIGPRKSRDALSDFCQRIVNIEKGERPTLIVGNTSAVRDFVDIRDCISALILLAQKGVGGEVYNICNGKTHNLTDILDLLQSESRKKFSIETHQDQVRKVDDLRIVGSNQKLQGISYKPQYSLQQTVQDTLNYWRERK